jgi:hypothetical protein
VPFRAPSELFALSLGPPKPGADSFLNQIGHCAISPSCDLPPNSLPLARGGALFELRRGIGWTIAMQYAALSALAECPACPVVYSSHLAIVPSDRDRIPARFGDNATVSGIAAPINARALFEILRFVYCYWRWCTSVAGRMS